MTWKMSLSTFAFEDNWLLGLHIHFIWTRFEIKPIIIILLYKTRLSGGGGVPHYLNKTVTPVFLCYVYVDKSRQTRGIDEFISFLSSNFHTPVTLMIRWHFLLACLWYSFFNIPYWVQVKHINTFIGNWKNRMSYYRFLNG